jgi:serine/threonine protein kinase
MKTFGSYAVTEELQRKSRWGSVFRATSTSRPSPAAVHVFEPKIEGIEQRWFGLLSEQLVALTHPRLARTHEVGHAHGLVYLAQSPLQGIPLSQLPTHSLPPWQTLVQELVPVADALEACHRTLGAHGGLDLPTLLINEANELFVLDAGLSRLFDHSLSPPFLRVPGEPLDPAADLYALGNLLHRVLAGQGPFWSPDPHVLRHLHLHATPPVLPDTVPPKLRRLVLGLLDKLPLARPGLDEVRSVIRGLKLHEVTPTPTPTTVLVQLMDMSPVPVELKNGQLTIGSAPDNTIPLPRSDAALHHAKLVHRDSKFILLDLKSPEGTWVDGRRLAAPQVLRTGAEVRIGKVTLRFTPRPEGACQRCGGAPEPQSRFCTACTRLPAGREVQLT